MAIAKMNHFNLYTMNSDTDKILSLIQNYGDVHISEIADKEELLQDGLEYVSEPSESASVQQELSRLTQTIELLSKYEEKSGSLETMKKGLKNYTYSEVMAKGAVVNVDKEMDEISKLNRHLENQEINVSKIKTQLAELEPWKNLKLGKEDISNTRKINFVTGHVLSRQFKALQEEAQDLTNTHIELVSDMNKNSYFLAITTKDERTELDKLLRKYSYFSVNLTGSGSPELELVNLKHKIEEINEEIANTKVKFKDYLYILDDLKLRYEYLNQIGVKYKSTENLLSTKTVNFIEGYIETSKADDFINTLEENFGDSYHIEMEEADKEDPNVPIVLKNSRFVSAFEQLTKMYALPKYNEIDPTPFLAPFYWLFFGMMIADIGYGLILLVGTLFALKAFNLSESMETNIRFFFYMSISTILWGLIYGSFFGGVIELPALINPATDYIALLAISVAFGGVHMFLGLGIKAYTLIRDGKPMDAVYDVLFWYMSLIGAIYMVMAGALNLPGENIGKYVMIAGMVGILLFGGRESTSIGGRFALGAYTLYGISSWLGDFVSYLRLMALGLAGAFIGVAVNMIVGTVAGSGIIGIVFAAVIFVGGQLFNLALSALSAYVHTLRLTFVEFFGKFYEGGGKEFKKIRNKPKYINIRNQED